VGPEVLSGVFSNGHLEVLVQLFQYGANLLFLISALSLLNQVGSGNFKLHGTRANTFYVADRCAGYQMEHGDGFIGSRRMPKEIDLHSITPGVLVEQKRQDLFFIQDLHQASRITIVLWDGPKSGSSLSALDEFLDPWIIHLSCDSGYRFVA